MSETSLHQAIKTHYAGSHGLKEALVDGFLVDVVHGDVLIEIQTRNFSALKPKLNKLLDNHPVHLVYPIAIERWLVTLDPLTTVELKRRRSPRRGRLEDLFYELVRIPHLVNRPNFSLEVLLIRELEIRLADGRGSWRRGGVSIIDRRLLEILEARQFNNPQDYRIFLPAWLPSEFTSKQYAANQKLPPRLAGKVIYCLHQIGLLHRTGKRTRSWLYEVTCPNAAASLTMPAG